MVDIHTMPLPKFPDEEPPEKTNVISLVKKPIDDTIELDETGKPVDLLGSFIPPNLPTGLLPQPIECFSRTMGDMVGADPAGFAMAGLVACATAIPDSVQLQVKQHDPNWIVSARIWSMLIGAPSTKKTPIIKIATGPLYSIDKKTFEAHQMKLAEYNATPKQDRIGPPPKPSRIIMEDTTMEAAQEIMAGSPEGVALIDDEMSGFFGRIEKYSGKGGSADRSFWLKSFDGGPYMVNRIGRGGDSGMIISNISASMLGGIQPQAIKEVASSAADDGLIQRFFPILLKSAQIGKDEPIPGVTSEHAALINALHKLEANDVLKFDAEAQAIRLREEGKNHRLQVFEEINTKLASHIGKYDGLFARLCLIWHCIEHAQTEELPLVVTGKTARKVATFMEKFLFPHALSFYATILDERSDQHQILEVAKHILAHRLSVVTNADLQSNVNATRNMSKLGRIGILETLEGLGWATELSTIGPKRSERWLVNAEVHEMFEHHAKTARRKKKELRKVMNTAFSTRREAKR